MAPKTTKLVQDVHQHTKLEICNSPKIENVDGLRCHANPKLNSRGDNISYFSEKKLINIWSKKAVLIALFGATLWLIRSGLTHPIRQFL